MSNYEKMAASGEIQSLSEQVELKKIQNFTMIIIYCGTFKVDKTETIDFCMSFSHSSLIRNMWTLIAKFIFKQLSCGMAGDQKLLHTSISVEIFKS